MCDYICWLLKHYKVSQRVSILQDTSLFSKLFFYVRQCLGTWHCILQDTLLRAYHVDQTLALAGTHQLPSFSKDFEEVLFRHRFLMS